MMAVQAGAQCVTACERTKTMYRMAKQALGANRYPRAHSITDTPTKPLQGCIDQGQP